MLTIIQNVRSRSLGCLMEDSCKNALGVADMQPQHSFLPRFEAAPDNTEPLILPAEADRCALQLSSWSEPHLCISLVHQLLCEIIHMLVVLPVALSVVLPGSSSFTIAICIMQMVDDILQPAALQASQPCPSPARAGGGGGGGGGALHKQWSTEGLSTLSITQAHNGIVSLRCHAGKEAAHEQQDGRSCRAAQVLPKQCCHLHLCHIP